MQRRSETRENLRKIVSKLKTQILDSYIALRPGYWEIKYEIEEVTPLPGSYDDHAQMAYILEYYLYKESWNSWDESTILKAWKDKETKWIEIAKKQEKIFCAKVKEKRLYPPLASAEKIDMDTLQYDINARIRKIRNEYKPIPVLFPKENQEQATKNIIKDKKCFEMLIVKTRKIRNHYVQDEKIINIDNIQYNSEIDFFVYAYMIETKQNVSKSIIRTLKCILVNLNDFHCINFIIELHMHPQTSWCWTDHFPLTISGVTSFAETLKHNDIANIVKEKLSIITLNTYIGYKNYVNNLKIENNILVSIRLIELFQYCREHIFYIENKKKEQCKCKSSHRYNCNCGFSEDEVDVNEFRE